MDTVLPHQYQYQYLLIVITPSDLPLPSGFCHPKFPLRSLISPSPTSCDLSRRFYYYYYHNFYY